MAVINKPNDLSTIWSSSGDLVKPTPTKIATGWEVEVPPRQWFNWLDNRQDQAIAHINQFGIPVWDSVTEYQGGRSFTTGSDGRVYRCVVTNIGNNPAADTAGTYWQAVVGGSSDYSDSENGYALLAGNIYQQWGTTSGTDSDGYEVVTFPKPLSVGVFSFVTTHFGLNPAIVSEIIANRTLTQTTIRVLDENGAAVAGRRVSFNLIGK